MPRQFTLHWHDNRFRTSYGRTFLSGGEKCAKYTLHHKPKKLEIAWESENRILASKLEFHIKKNLTKKQKEELIQNPQKLGELLEGKIDDLEYKIAKLSPKHLKKFPKYCII